MKLNIFIAHLCFLFSSVFGQVKRPRGVAISKASFYQPGGDFTCIDGSNTIAYEKINDDYCDCSDGSDEPGTAACPNGSFHCTNAGYKPKYIPSSRVNDGICDCCDGGDEYNGKITCANYCKELGKQMREELEKKRALLVEGYEIYKEYVHKGTQAKQERQAKVDDLRKERDDLKALKDELEAKKNEAEKPEQEAKDKHKAEWEERKTVIKAERNKKHAQEVFEELDTNKDNLVNVAEMQLHPEFDIDNSGDVSQEEAQEYLEDFPQVNFDVFFEKIWENIKQIYKKPGTYKAKDDNSESQPPQEQEPPKRSQPPLDEDSENEPDTEIDDEDEDNYDDRYDDDEDDYREEEEEDKDEEDEDKDLKMPEYDQDTRTLIQAADEARRQYEDANKKFNDVDRELGETERILELDMGHNNEFYPLRGECYEYTDREYTYKLCPFEKCTQRNKHGGIETNLGHWGKWDGPENKKYDVMLLEKGQNCWHGPDRICRVKIECGIHNEVTHTREPNRCEYEYEFSSPAACREPPQQTFDPLHDEL